MPCTGLLHGRPLEKSATDFIRAVVYGKKVIATFIVVIDVGPSGDYLPQTIGL